ncbi:hypothetical protein HRR83_006628 [Exophiala dermatitidis]|nr:hypothetical protein HRR74_005788 [Exophiala dermatitidis]KAJ4515387.1 hypothetical protein HRR73_005218 [Exophiala dermatitidis]KAJ4540914.1 hypothetical protein HRR76_004297 [Exophiala dermatitidis]KAJ4569871.1 hypothetical protein HRR81_006347 [Exophiala dermatitidis]KAJ4592872.1 hypothetical protein HRR83_006628 [Exophiala dermatitidis]
MATLTQKKSKLNRQQCQWSMGTKMERLILQWVVGRGTMACGQETKNYGVSVIDREGLDKEATQGCGAKDDITSSTRSGNRRSRRNGGMGGCVSQSLAAGRSSLR